MPLSLSQLEQYDLQAGWPADLVPTAAAVEEAESGGDPTAVGPQFAGDQGSWGLFQVQTGAHPDLVARYGQSLLSDPMVESKAGLDIYRSSGWGAWSTYTGGQYKKWLSPAQQAAGRQGTQPNTAAAPGHCDPSTGTWTDAKCGAVDPGCGVQNWSGAVMCKLRWGAGRAAISGQVFLGLMVVAAGLWLLIKDTDVGRTIRAGARTAVTTAAKAAA